MRHNFEPSRFSSLNMPVLFLQGSRTSDTLGEVMRRLHPHMPQAAWHTFEGEGHGAQMRAPKAFSDIVIAFLTS
jgi:pimeloyl-ACP methyl ester carboxylesterase